MTKRAVTWIAAVTTLTFGLPATLAFAQNKDPIRIGVPTSMSGPFAVIFPEIKRSIEFAAAQANAAGGVDGRKVEVRFLDTEAKPDVARRQAEKLALEGFNLLTGTVTSGEGLAMSPMLERWDAIYVNTFAKNTKLTGDTCSSRLFRVNQADPHDIAVIKPWLETRQEKKWVVIGADMAWGRETSKSFIAAASSGGKQVLGEYYPAFGANDYAPFIQQIKAANPEGVFAVMSGRDAINFLNQAKQFGLLDSVVLGGVSINLASVIKAVGAPMKGVWGNMNYSASIDTAQNKEFVAAWKKAHDGAEPSDLEGENYVGMQVILQAVEKAKSVKPGDVAKALSGGTFDTVFGKATIRKEDHQMILPNYFGQVREVDGVLKNVAAITVSADKATPPADPACKK